MKQDQPRNGCNGHSHAHLSAEQELAFKSMVLLPKANRREILDMVIMFELIEDQTEGKTMLGRLREIRL